MSPARAAPSPRAALWDPPGRIPTNTRNKKTPTPQPPHDRRCRNQEDRNAYEHRNGGGLTMHTMLENDRRFALGKISASRGTPLWSS